VSELRPRTLGVVAGTGTEVGKTWVAARLAAGLRARRWRVGARKPAQSFAAHEHGRTDAEQLAAATGEAPEAVCPRARWYEAPLAPPMAAEALGRPAFALADLVRELAASWPRPPLDLALVELAGGPRSPLAGDGDGVELARRLAPEWVLLVADAGLGTLNAVRLSAAAFAALPLLVHLNRYDAADDLHRRNRAWLTDRDGFTVSTDLEALLGAVEARLPTFCPHCGGPTRACPSACARPLDPPHFCPRCARKLVVQLSPTSHRAHCPIHGELADPPPHPSSITSSK
jgi:dethiobiotin synthetase